MADKQDDVSIESIKVKLGGETKTLTLEQAKKLRDALNEMFGVAPATCYRRHCEDGYWSAPWRIYPNHIYWATSDSTKGYESANAPQAMCLSVDLDAK
jgi:hypothetical protein